MTGTTREIENLYSYDGFGNLLEKKEDFTNRILYTGQQYDQETGQYYLRARYYNPVIGRLTQEDTYRGDGLNLYAYCRNNPVMYYDPSGYEPCKGQEQKETAPKPVDEVGEGGSSTFYTVQNGQDAERLLSDGQPWPTEATRANLGDGVYAWDNMEDAQRYLERRQERIPEQLTILQFEVDNSDSNSMRTLDTRGMTDDAVDDFLNQYGRLRGGTPNHEYDHIINGTNPGVEHYFNKTIFDKLHF